MSKQDPEMMRWTSNHTCYKSPIWFYVLTYCLSILSAIGIFTILFMSLKPLLCNKNDNRILLDAFIARKSSKALYLFIIILYSLGPSLFTLAFSLQMGCGFIAETVDDKKFHFHMMMVVAVQSMTIATETLYLFFVLRLKTLFEGIGDLSLNFFIFIFLLFPFPLMLAFQALSFYHYIVDFHTFNWDAALQWGHVALYIYIAFSINLLVVFVYKNYKLKNSVLIQSNERNSVILNFSVRYLWLAAICIISTNLIGIINLYRTSAGMKMYVIMLKNMLLVIDSFINVLCLYLQFKFADTLYFNVCFFCHTKWLKCFGDVDSNLAQKRKSNGCGVKNNRWSLILKKCTKPCIYFVEWCVDNLLRFGRLFICLWTYK